MRNLRAEGSKAVQLLTQPTSLCRRGSWASNGEPLYPIVHSCLFHLGQHFAIFPLLLISRIKACFSQMGTIKDRNGMDITEAEGIKKTWQEYTEELHKKDLHDPDNHDGVITHLEPDILEGEVKWALGNITTNKASGGDGIPFELFQILKDDAVKVLHSICQQIWKTQQWP